MNILKIIAICFMFNLFNTASYADGHKGSILDALKNDARFTSFSDAVMNSGLEQLFSEKHKAPKTIYVPTDTAFNNLPDTVKSAISNSGNKDVLRKLVRTHYFVGTHDDLKEGQKVKGVNVDGILIDIYQDKDLFVKDMVIRNKEIKVGNSKIVPIDCVMFLQPSSTDYRLSSEQRENYPITTCCLRSEAEVSAFLGGLK